MCQLCKICHAKGNGNELLRGLYFMFKTTQQADNSDTVLYQMQRSVNVGIVDKPRA